jgi:ubiquinone/menaquinone biosynthesis C-methylase UbiE
MGVYQRIGKSFNKTRRADPFIASRLSFHLQIRGDCRYLDIACGTGNYTLAMAASGGAWHGVDVSAIMIDQARQGSRDVDLVIGQVERLPYEAGVFAGATCTLAIHHFESLDAAFGEIHRHEAGPPGLIHHNARTDSAILVG